MSVTMHHDPPLWNPLVLTRVLADDNPQSLRVRKYLTGTHMLLASGPASVAPTPRQLTRQRGPVRLWRYTGGSRRLRTPVVIVYAMLLRPYILDLVGGRSLIGFLVDEGHDVWLVDWGDPGPGDSGTDLASFIDDDLRTAVATVRDASGSRQVTLVGHCQGGTLGAIYAALQPDEIRNLVLLAAPVDFAPGSPHAIGAWSLWSRQPWYDPRALVDRHGTVPAHLPGRALAAWSASTAWAAPWLRSMRSGLEADVEGRTWLAACQWVDDSPPLPGTAWVQWLTACYQRNALVAGRMRISDRPVRLGDVTAEVLRISGRRDIVAPPQQMARPEHLPAAATFTVMHVSAGHVGMVAGPACHTAVYRPLARWLAARSS